jgi:hypothetical protein
MIDKNRGSNSNIMEPGNSHSIIKKRQALDMETEDNISRSLSKKVSFGRDSLIEVQKFDPLKDISKFLLETENQIEKEKKEVFLLLTQPSKAGFILDKDLSSLKQDLRLCVLVDQTHLNQTRAKLDCDKKIIENLQLLKENTVKNCQNSVNIALKQWEAANFSQKEAKKNLSDLKKQLVKEKQIKGCYKDLAKHFGVKFQDSESSKIVQINEFLFKLEKNKSEFIVSQQNGPEKMLMDGKNRLHREELGTFFFRVLDR